MAQTADVVVIGAGIIGCATAYFLAADGHRVVVVERDDIAAGTASASGGWIVVHNRETPEKVAFALRSRHLYERLATEINLPLVPTEGMILAASADELSRLHRQAEMARRGGATVDVLDGASLRDVEPAVNVDLPGGTLCPDEAVTDPPAACRAFARAAQARGAVVRTRSPVTAIEVAGGRITGVRVGPDWIATPVVVCACGVQSPAIGRLVGVDIPVIPRRGHIIHLAQQPLVRRPMLEAGYLDVSGPQSAADPSGLRFLLQPKPAGGYAVGSSREFAGEDRTPDLALIERIHARAARFVPAVAAAVTERITVGLRPYTPLGHPVIGRAGPDGFLVAAGHEGEGITLAPVTGRIVADLVAGRMASTGFELPPERVREQT
jgi:glycine/D-amino acid oxidase-like deaminating enzyme